MSDGKTTASPVNAWKWLAVAPKPVLSPLVYQGCSFELRERNRDEFRLTMALRVGARPSLTFFRATIGELRALPRHIGLDAAHVTASYDAEHGIYDVALPKSRTLVDRAFPLLRKSAQLVLGSELLGSPLTLGFEAPTDEVGCRVAGTRDLPVRSPARR